MTKVELSKRAVIEQEILQFWQKKNIFRRHIEKNQSGPVFCFYEGPPTANGKPGIHHVLSRVFKDIYIRYYGLKGYHIPRKAGWDCHGLPVEREVEKELGIQTKSEIETKYGLAKFNELCRKSVLKYVDAWNQFTERLGFWVDLDDPYFTMDNSYIESVWSLIKQINDKGLLYQGYKVVPFDPVMGATMSDAEVALGYKTVQDPSVTVKFTINDTKAGDLNGAEFLVWTTTPWTLPANVALALNSNQSYVLFEAKLADKTDRFICALPLYESVIAQKKDEGIQFTKLKSYQGSDLAGLSYERLYDFTPVPAEKKGWYTVTADFVTMDSGTGIVHIAPAYGADDLQVGIEKDLPVIYGAGLDGKFDNGPFAGLFFKDADKEVLKELKLRNKIWKSETYSHDYPFGWRTGAPLMYYAKDAWYIRTTQIRDQLIQNNQNIRWVPGHIKEGRFGNWLENNRDWALSRERYWGTPLPVWADDDGNFEVIGSVAELESKVGRKLNDLDLHRPFIDEITYTNPKTGKIFRRTPEVIDCWFDSGSMPYSQWQLTDTDNRERFFPADFISEAVDQTRGWFYTLLAISTMISNQSSYKNVVCLGHVLDAKGEKMSKSKGNTVDPWHVFNVHGADAIRWYFLTGAPPGNSRRIGAPGSQGDPLPLVQGFFNMIHNSLEFYYLYAKADKVEFSDLKEATEVKDRPEIDRWVLARLQKLIQDVSEGLTEYDCLRAGRQIEQFVDSLSNWYIRRNRRRFWKGERDADKLAAYDTLYQCLKTLSILMAPFTPFLAEELYQKLKTEKDPESVHLCDWPKANSNLIDEVALVAGDSVMLVASLGRSARQRSARKVRQPLSKVMVFTPPHAQNAVKANEAVLLDELNVKELVFLEDAGSYFSYSVKPNLPVLGKKIGPKIKFLQQYLKTANTHDLVHQIKSGDSFEISLDNELYSFNEDDFLIEGLSKEGTSGSEANGFVVIIDTNLTDDLIREGFARDLVRQIQELRKKAGFEITDRIDLYLKPSVELAELAIRDFIGYIEQETLATRSKLIDAPDISESFDNSIEISIKRKTR
ncbi:MAG: isoleucine--tRNA ligase [Leptonema sp. (in: Bacteria)]|nr:isoleucine--tRNA ligase [Leptonema sp. (in: bacteria)]